MKTIKIEIKNIFKPEIKDFIFYSNMVKRKIKFIKKQRRYTKKIYQKVLNFLFKRFQIYIYIWKMYILADIKKLQKIMIYIGTKTTFDFSDKNKNFFNLKDFIFNKYICKKKYILAFFK